MALIDCTECGHQVSDQAAACPHCGHPVTSSSHLESSEETKSCPKCAEQIKKEARICKHCGYDFVRAERSGCGPAFLSLLIPGLGQLAKGQVLSGVLFFFVAMALWFVYMGWIVNIVSAVAAYSKEQ